MALRFASDFRIICRCKTITITVWRCEISFIYEIYGGNFEHKLDQHETYSEYNERENALLE